MPALPSAHACSTGQADSMQCRLCDLCGRCEAHPGAHSPAGEYGAWDADNWQQQLEEAIVLTSIFEPDIRVACVHGLPACWVDDVLDPEQLLGAGLPPQPAHLTLAVTVQPDLPACGLQLLVDTAPPALPQPPQPGSAPHPAGVAAAPGHELPQPLQPLALPPQPPPPQPPPAGQLHLPAGPPPLPAVASSGAGSAAIPLGSPVHHLPPLHLSVVLPHAYPSHAPPVVHARAVWLTQGQAAVLAAAARTQWEAAGGQQGEGGGAPALFQFLDWCKSDALSHLGIATAASLLLSDYPADGALRCTPLSSEALLAAPASPSSNEKGRAALEGLPGAQPEGWPCELVELAAGLAGGMQGPAEETGLGILQYAALREHHAFLQALHRCPVCFDDVVGGQCVRLPGCNHCFCRPCLSQYCSTQVADGQVENLRCPDLSCRAALLPAVLQELLPADQFARWESLLLQRTLDKMQDLAYCPRCSSAVVEDADHCGQCSQCLFVFCSLCQQSWHPGVECVSPAARLELLAQRRRGDLSSEERRQREEALISELKSMDAIRKTAKSCPSCRMSIEKSGGCNKMVCSFCSTKFCWACSMVIQDYTHFGSERCPLLDAQEIAAWEQRMAAMDAWDVFGGGQLGHPGLGGELVRVVGGAAPRLQMKASACPSCGQLGRKTGRNNLLRCNACGLHHCYTCKAALRTKPGKHYSHGARCKQHDDT